MGKYLQKHFKLAGVVLFGLVIVVGFIYAINNVRTSKIKNQSLKVEQNKLTLQVGGYGYTVGDIVQIKTGQPVLGDVVVYDPFKNRSMCLGMGSKVSLGKILGMPGETFSFQNTNLRIRTEIIKLDKDYSQQKAVFGNQKYENLHDETISLKNGEYLIDKWVGLECFAGELDKTRSSIFYNRFTVNQEAIISIIVKKIGHDKQAEESFKNRAY